MAISFDTAFGFREAAVTLRAQRASVLSSNLANADTPDFKARDIDFHSAMKSVVQESGGLRATQSRHITESTQVNGSSALLYRLPTQPSIDGNTVEENVEHAEFMKNSMEFQVAFTMLNSSIKGLRKAITGE